MSDNIETPAVTEEAHPKVYVIRVDPDAQHFREVPKTRESRRRRVWWVFTPGIEGRLVGQRSYSVQEALRKFGVFAQFKVRKYTQIFGSQCVCRANAAMAIADKRVAWEKAQAEQE